MARELGDRAVKANLYWLSQEEGGRQSPVPFQMAGFTYWSTARVDGLDQEWSFGVTLSPGCGCYFVGFLVDEAPHDTLVSGKKFEIKEGGKVVCRGVVQ